MNSGASEIERIVGKHVVRNQRASRLRWYRRVSWGITADRLERQFKALADHANSGLPSLYVYRNDESRMVQLSFGWHPIAASKSEIESGAALVVSQNVLGGVLVTLYPFESKKLKRLKPRLIWGHFDGPHELSNQDILRMLDDFLLYSRVSSAWMVASWCEQLKVALFEARSRSIEGGADWFGRHHAAVAALAIGSVAAAGTYVTWILLGEQGGKLEPWVGLITLVTGWIAFYASRLREAVDRVRAKEEADRADAARQGK